MSGTVLRVSAMMFLEFFIWGAWFVTLGTYLGHGPLGANGSQIAAAYLSQSIGAILAPFVVGLIADRYWSAQHILAVMQFGGAVLMWIAPTMTSFRAFLVLIMLYMVLFMPTLALVNAVAMRHMRDPRKQFPPIRVIGSFGWIVAGLVIALLNWEQQHRLDLTFKMASIAGFIFSMYAFSLPDTPPLKRNMVVSFNEIFGLDALKLLKNRSYLIFFITSIAICIPLSFYYNFTNSFLNEIGIQGATGLQSLGQMSEVLLMLAMPALFATLGVKMMLTVSMVAWVIRYVLFAYGYAHTAYWLLIIGIALHGICYDFFFVTGQIYTDSHAGTRFRGAAQGLITLATYGVGMLIGTYLSGVVVDHFTHGTIRDWRGIWTVPALISFIVLIIFLAMFRDKKSGAM
ncbi:MFS transporter [Burkholderia contaminans]|uniref:MFS transporter n=1 Tax=Burkholderia contaminans TaxID=488447 RepID=UPI00158D7F10|nr:MFS transporter [Burkholderia contaminans]